MSTEITMNGLEMATQDIQIASLTQSVLPKPTMPPAQEELKPVNNLQQKIIKTEAKIKSRRLTNAEKKKLTTIIKSELLEEHPLQAIALKHNLTMPFLLKLFAELMQSDFRTEVKHPSYEVCSAGTPASKLPFKMLKNAKFIRVEPHENGLYIQCFNLED